MSDPFENHAAVRVEQARAADERRRELDAAVLRTFTTESGRAVWEWLEGTCYAYRSTLSGQGAVDPLATAHNEGRRRVWLELRAAMERAKSGNRAAVPTVRPSVSQEDER